MKLHGSVGALAAFLITLSSASTQAAPILTNLGNLSGNVTTNGTLSDEAQVIEDMFTLTSMSTVTAFTTSYGGGSNLDGSMSTPGGFQSMITLYDAAGNYVMGEEVTSPVAETDSATGLALDAYLQATNLMPGSYIVTLTDWQTQQPATVTNLSDGFNGPGGTAFLDVQGNRRTGNFALNLSAMSMTATPEPATLWLIVPGMLFAMFLARRRSAKVTRAER
jgi:hypothetical protein